MNTSSLKKINVALCSYGMSGRVFHGPLLETHPGFKISKILERNRSESEGHHPNARIVRDYDSILEDPEVELVVVNTPDHLHHEMASRSLQAGKHTVVEKPFTLIQEDAGDLINKAREKNLVLSVFQNRRWDGDFLTVREIIRSGLLGRLVDFESHFDRYRTTINPSWKDRSTGTGTLYNLGSHLIDQALVLFGMPDRLFCDVRLLREGAMTDDSYDLFLHYSDVKCLLRSSYLVREQGPRFILHGTGGSFLKWGIDPQEEALNTGKIPVDDTWGLEEESSWGKINAGTGMAGREGRYPTLTGNYLAYYDNIHDAILKGAPLAVTAEQARNVIRIIEAGYRSSREGRVVSLE